MLADGGLALASLLSTALHVAQYGRSQLVSLLLEHGANPLEIDLKGNLPVHMACSNAHAVCVERLLYAQASLSMKNIFFQKVQRLIHHQ